MYEIEKPNNYIPDNWYYEEEFEMDESDQEIENLIDEYLEKKEGI